jgi:hypothetical protein
MTRPLELPARQVAAICRGAARAGCIAVIRIGGVVVELVPKDVARAAANPLDNDAEAALDAELAAFEAKHGDG